MRPMLPAFSAVYGLKWEDIERMPHGERQEYLKQLEDWMKLLSGSPLMGEE